jgi:hypothetical protein
MRDEEKNKMLAEEDRADANREMTDVTRHLVRVTRDNARQWQRVKPDPEVHPLAGLDWEKEPMWDEPLVTTPLPHLCSERTDCIALAIQPPALSGQPTGKDRAAAM